jgi:hypothetical protein
LAHIDIFADKVKSSCHAIRAQIADLEFAALVFRADTCVDSDSHNVVLLGGERERLVLRSVNPHSATLVRDGGVNINDTGRRCGRLVSIFAADS